MPDMDGWSVLRALKADPELRDVPVVMLTMVDDKTKGYSLGATDYLTKPVDGERLREILRRHQTPEEPASVLLVDDDAGSPRDDGAHAGEGRLGGRRSRARAGGARAVGHDVGRRWCCSI